jgi:ribulose-5-phosphate 4-epimerase/fuculose-1-phosphate aldolase
MVNKTQTNIPFQTFFISREISKSPLIEDIITFNKKFSKSKIINKNQTNISLSFGKRILITADNIDIENMGAKDIVEIVDYDPIKKIFIVIGSKIPSINASVHWLIHRARDDVNAIVQVIGENPINKFSKNSPITESEYPLGTLELAKEILKTLRINKRIVIKNVGCLCVGINLKEIENLIL